MIFPWQGPQKERTLTTSLRPAADARWQKHGGGEHTDRRTSSWRDRPCRQANPGSWVLERDECKRRTNTCHFLAAVKCTSDFPSCAIDSKQMASPDLVSLYSSTRALVILDQEISSSDTSLGHCTTTLPVRTYTDGGILFDQSHRPKSFRRLDRVSSWIFSAAGLTQPGHFSGRKSHWSWQEDTHTRDK
jgi:hypothetical protein